MAKTFTPSPGFSRDGDLLRSGTTVGRNASARLGFMPLALQHVILEGLAEIPVFLRTVTRRRDKPEYQFTLYATVATRFTEHHRERLKEAGVKFIYIQLSQQMRFHRQVEDYLDSAMRDPAVTTSAKSELLYETSVELVDELLVEQDLAEKLPRLESIARAVTTLVMNDTAAFSHLFATAQHDFYTATHMVNVGTWMVPLGYACGIEDMGQLNLLCQAGMLHDIGKVFISETTLNKAGALSEQDWQELRTHPALGHNRLGICNGVPDLVRRVALEHHERVDGSGYPAGLAGEAILLASRICAVVDSFDAMTAFRPFKERTMSFGEALRVLRDEAGSKYDQRVVDAWAGLMRQTDADCTIPEDLRDQGKPLLGRRKHERFAVDCQAQRAAHRACRRPAGRARRDDGHDPQHLALRDKRPGPPADRGESVCAGHAAGVRHAGAPGIGGPDRALPALRRRLARDGDAVRLAGLGIHGGREQHVDCHSCRELICERCRRPPTWSPPAATSSPPSPPPSPNSRRFHSEFGVLRSECGAGRSGGVGAKSGVFGVKIQRLPQRLPSGGWGWQPLDY